MSLADPDARPIRKGKAAKPTEFGSIPQIAEITAAHAQRRARLRAAAGGRARNPGEEKLVPRRVAELQALGLAPAEVVVDGGERRLQAHPRPAGRLLHRLIWPHRAAHARLRPQLSRPKAAGTKTRVGWSALA
jgi:hypothetical protein